MDFLEAFDLGTLYWFGSWHRPWLDPVMVLLTHLGDFAILAVVCVAAAGCFLLARRPRVAGLLLACWLLSELLQWSIKPFVARPRPDVVWRLVPLPDSFSFPSGHALVAAAVYVALALVASGHLRRPALRVLVIAAGLLVGLLVGLTRVYLGVHYPIDVIAGWCAGLALALIFYSLAGQRRAFV
jgi:undecaprenyl-diphosphatase